MTKIKNFLFQIRSIFHINITLYLQETSWKITLFVAILLLHSLPLPAQNSGKTSIAMLNYLATQSRIIVDSKNNRVTLEDLYNKLINNSDPTVIDERTLEFLRDMLDNIESFRIITYQRERLQFLFENQQAQAITKAMPNPLYLLGTLNSNMSTVTIMAALAGNPVAQAKFAADTLKTLASFTAMAIDSMFKYESAMNDAKLAYMQGDWELNDKESAILHSLRSRSFVYMVNISTQYKLSTGDTLNEKTIDDFVEISLWNATPRKRQTLEANRVLYAKYAPYWLALADTYFELGLFRECLNAVKEYENINAPIFRKDKDFARLIPKAIVAALNVYGNTSDYINFASGYLQKLVNNTSDTDWALRYFAAQTYISMAADTNKSRTLDIAYDLLLNNVRVLSIEQENLLNEYWSPVTAVPQSLIVALEGAQKKLTQLKIDKETLMNSKNTKLGKEQRAAIDKDIKEAENKVKEWESKIDNYKKTHEKELPPFSHALWLNYNLLQSLYGPLNKKESDKLYVRGIIGEAFLYLDIMEAYKKDAQSNVLRNMYNIKSNPRSQSFFGAIAKGWNYGDRLFYLNCPDVTFTELNSIDIKIFNPNTNVVLCEEKNVKWEAISKYGEWGPPSFKSTVTDFLERSTNKLSQVYENISGIALSIDLIPPITLAEIGVYLSYRPDYKKNEAYKMEILIKNIDDQGSCTNRLHFERPAGKTDWRFVLVE